jgi:hypothetical protein
MERIWGIQKVKQLTRRINWDADAASVSGIASFEILVVY